MTATYVQLPSDGAGKKLAAESWTQGADIVHGQKLLVCDASGNVVNVVSNRLAVDGSGVTQPVDTELPAAAAVGDTEAASAAVPQAAARGLLFDGTNWVRHRTATNGMATGIAAMSPMIWDTGSSFNVWAAPASDVLGQSDIGAVGGMLYTGTTWVRPRGDVANGADVDVTRLPALPTGSNTIGKVDQGAGGASAWKVDGSAATQPVSAASLPLPSGAATSAAQTDGTQKAISRGGAKGVTTSADITSTAEGADHQAQDVQVYHSGAAIDPRDVSDRAGRLLGVIASITAAVDVSDRAARLLGHVTVDGGDVDHDAVNTLKVQQVGGNAQPADNPPAAVSAAGDRVRLWADRYGAQVVRNRKVRESYTAAFRLAETTARLDQTFTQVANTTKQWATLHHLVGATKDMRLHKCWLYITSDTVAGVQGVVELRELDGVTAPATGNPAITPRPHRKGGGASEGVALYLPGTQGSESNVNQPLGHVPFDTGISGSVSTVNPVPVLVPVVLWDSSAEDPELVPPTIPVGVAGGWGVSIRTVGVPVLRCTVFMRFSEEIV